MSDFTVYARLEPTDDTVSKQYLAPKMLARCFDVVIYHDPEGRRFYCRFPFYYSSRPRKNQRRVTINCFRYKLAWIPE